MMLYKYIVKNVANQYGKTVTFMPKPLFQDNGSGMHTHQSLEDRETAFAGRRIMQACRRWLCTSGGLIKPGPRSTFGDHCSHHE